jgi:hypothetical protein
MALKTYRQVDNSVTSAKILESCGVDNSLVIFDGLPTVTISTPIGTTQEQLEQIDLYMLEHEWVSVL